MVNILEATKRELIQKSEKADKVKAYNSTRYERRKYQKVASLQKDYNDFDMDALFKGKRVTLNVGVKGETDDYVVKVSWDNLLDLIKERVKLNKGKWDLKCAYLALLQSFNESNIYISCTCDDWKFRFSYYSTVNDYNSGAPEVRVSDITNPNDTKGAGCKHTMAVLTEGGIFMKLAICITNYVNYMQKTHPDLYQDIIVPAIYGSGKKPEYSLEDADELEKPLDMKPDRPEFKVENDDEFIPFNVEEE